MIPLVIKSFYANIRHNVFYKAIEYWIEKLHNKNPLLRRFTKAVILDRLSINLEFNYCFNNNYFYHQIKRTVMGTIFAVVGSSLRKLTIFWRKNVYDSTADFPKYFLDFFTHNYFWFLVAFNKG